MSSLTPLEVLALVADEIARSGVATTTIGGSIRFDVVGAGDWTVSLGTPGGRWAQSQPADEADVTVVIPQEHFAALLEPDEIDALLAIGTVQVRGDAAKLAALGTLLCARGTTTDLRIDAAREGGCHARTRR